MEDWNCISQKQPVCDDTVYWVIGGEFGEEEPTLVRLSAYSRYINNAVDCWQTLNHDDWSMVGTKWIQVAPPELPTK